jgi:hypothetical protein
LNKTYLSFDGVALESEECFTLVWKVENYYIEAGRVLCVEVSIPLRHFIYVTIDDVKQAWFDMLRQFVAERPGFEVSWVMSPREDDALVTVRIGKVGNLKGFTEKESSDALSAVDALFERKAQQAKRTQATKRKTT